MTTPKKTKGRQKIEMLKIVNEKSLGVTFSKRHHGLFKKADKLCTLCGAKVTIIIFSPTKKPISFGIPSVKEIITSYLEQLPPPSSSISQFMESYGNANKEELEKQLTNMMAKLDVQKKICEKLDKIKKARQDRIWWDTPIETLNIVQFEKYKVGMLELKKNSKEQVERLTVEDTNITASIITPSYESTG